MTNDTPNNECEVSLKEKYTLLVNARNFHYENYNKWMTYFFIAISSLFLSFFTISKEQSNTFQDKSLYEIAILILGYIVSILWYWSSKGYYYWNINFISLVNHYEKDLFNWTKEERIYFVFANKKVQNNYLNPITGANISTSKVAIIFAFIVCAFWGFLLSYKILVNFFPIECRILILILSFLLAIISIFIFSTFIAKPYLFSKIDHLPDLKLTQDKVKDDE